MLTRRDLLAWIQSCTTISYIKEKKTNNHEHMNTLMNSISLSSELDQQKPLLDCIPVILLHWFQSSREVHLWLQIFFWASYLIKPSSSISGLHQSKPNSCSWHYLWITSQICYVYLLGKSASILKSMSENHVILVKYCILN